MHIQDLSEDDALMHFCFCKAHLQEVADKLWPRLQVVISGNRGPINMNNGTYPLHYMTLLFLVLYMLQSCIRKKIKGFFGIHKSNISTWMTCMNHTIHTLAVQYLDNPVIFHNRMSYYTERACKKSVGWLKLFWD